MDYTREAGIKMSALWDVTPSFLYNDAARISETSVYFHEPTLGYIPEDCHFSYLSL
jgi:hypothetical protein